VYRPQWSGLSTPEDVTPALALLEELGWLRREEVRPPSGRPTARFGINPGIERQPASAEAEPERAAEGG
jgi:hypothetical protein